MYGLTQLGLHLPYGTNLSEFPRATKEFLSSIIINFPGSVYFEIDPFEIDRTLIVYKDSTKNTQGCIEVWLNGRDSPDLLSDIGYIKSTFRRLNITYELR